jgi:hypothetical protein
MAALVGFIMVVVSLGLLTWNEGRAVGEMNSLNAGARLVVTVPADKIDPGNEQKLVHVTGPMTLNGAASDPLFHITPEAAVRLRRNVELYQWQEHEDTQTEKRVGGGETKRTTYTYTKTWSATPIDSSKFKRPDGHANPPMQHRTVTRDAKAVQVGGFRLDGSVVDLMSGFKPLIPADSASTAGVSPAFRRVGDKFFHGNTPETPEIGDIQIFYEIIDAQPVSIVAAQIGQTLAPFRGHDGRVIELVDLGTRSAGDMFQEAKSSAALLTWILRGVGFLVMLIGLCLLSAPLSWLASVLPFLAGIVDIAAFFAALMIAVPLTLITIAIAWMAFRPLLAAGLMAGGLVLAALLRWVSPARRVRRLRPAESVIG